MARRLQHAVRTSSLVGLGELLEVGKVVGAQLVDDAGKQLLKNTSTRDKAWIPQVAYL